YFWERFTTATAIIEDTGTIKTAIRVISQLILSIITNTPIIVVTEVISCVRPWLRVWFMVSTSLVTRDNTSPWFVPSKYLRGIRFIFSEISLRKPYVICLEIPAIIHPWIYVNNELSRYNPSRIRTI